MIIYLSGEDTFRSRERLKTLRQAFIKKYDPSGINVVHLEGDGLKLETFQAAVASQGFLSSRRFVVVDRPYDADKKTQEAVAQYVREKQIPEETIVVFWTDQEAPTRKRKDAEPSALAAVLRGVKNHEVFDPLEPVEVERWIIRRAKALGSSIERAAAERLAGTVGSNLWSAANELEKLRYLAHGRTITAADVAASVGEPLEADIFAFTDALSRKDTQRASALLEQQLRSGANELYLLTMLARQVRILLSVGDIVQHEPNPATIASRLKLHPFVVKKALQQVRTFSQRELIAAHDQLVEIDFKLKNTQANPRALLELFVLSVCATPSRVL
ncbi:MAG: DNA polymerase III subunit delta [Candidatus Kerfeldbacteria bacterium]|nr:DNA polymerase III subunit delta [Candidatus Kerfeldbacteria bacterium]